MRGNALAYKLVQLITMQLEPLDKGRAKGLVVMFSINERCTLAITK